MNFGRLDHPARSKEPNENKNKDNKGPANPKTNNASHFEVL
jgi:hypothetical protein